MRDESSCDDSDHLKSKKNLSSSLSVKLIVHRDAGHMELQSSVVF